MLCPAQSKVHAADRARDHGFDLMGMATRQRALDSGGLGFPD